MALLKVLAARETVVGEGRIRSHENIVFERHSVPQLDAAFDRDPVPDLGSALNERVVANIAIVADPSARQDVCIRPNASSLAHLFGLHDGGWVLEVAHGRDGPCMYIVDTRQGLSLAMCSEPLCNGVYNWLGVWLGVP